MSALKITTATIMIIIMILKIVIFTVPEDHRVKSKKVKREISPKT